MTAEQSFAINPELAEEIRDAIMFGRPGDLETLVENLAEDISFPAELRQGLEALIHYRAHYASVELSDVDRKKVNLMESAWAMELLNKIRANVSPVAKRA